MKHAIALRHVTFEDMGSLEDILSSCGYSYEYIDIPILTPAAIAEIDALAPDLLVILGGPMSVNDETDYPWIAAETDLISRRLVAKRPTIGFCLGAQFIAKALGAKVYPGPAPEIGWSELLCTERGRRLGFGLFEAGGSENISKNAADEGRTPRSDDDPTQVLHWHGETFDLPVCAERIASNDNYLNQAFAIGNYVLATQFHIEVRYPDLERWFAGHSGELHTIPTVNIPDLRSQCIKNCPPLNKTAANIFGGWLSQLPD